MSYNKETGMYEGYIYCATNLVNGKKYIGQTVTTIEHRKGQHYASTKNSSQIFPFKRAIIKYGKDNFKWECLYKEVANNRKQLVELLNEKEIESIKKYNTLIKNGNGYNVDEGGTHCSYLRKPVDAYDLYGNYIQSFDSCAEAGYYYGLDSSDISDLCKGNVHKKRNFDITFRYYGEDFGKYNPFQTGIQYYVYQYDCITGELLNRFDNTLLAADYIKTFYNTDYNVAARLYSALNSRKGVYAGYYWSKNETFDFVKYERTVEVDKYTVDGEYVETFLTLMDAAKSVGSRSIGIIKKMCLGNTFNPIFGHVWRFRGDDFGLYPVNKDYKGSKRPVDQYTLDGEYVATFETVTDATIKNNFTMEYSSHISACCMGKKQYALGYVWRYHGEPYTKPKQPKNQRKINCYTMDDIYVSTYDTAVDALKDIKGENAPASIRNNINACVAGRIKSSIGYHWFRADDPNQPDKTKIVA